MDDRRKAALEEIIDLAARWRPRYKAATKPSFISGQLSLEGREADEYDELLDTALTDPTFFDAACRDAGAWLDLEYPCEMPISLRKFAARVLSGEQKRPEHHGRYAENDDFKGRLVVEAVAIGLRHGFPATRNDASPHVNSACDLVAEAFSIAGLSPVTFSSIKQIFLSHRGRTNFD